MDFISPGYQLHIDSWENDADNGKTQIFSGLTKEDVQFYIYFLNHFISSSCTNTSIVLYGNTFIEEYPDAEKIAITNAYEKCRPTTPQLLKQVEDSIEYWKTSDYSCDWVDQTIGIWSQGERYRVFDYCKVYLVSTSIPNVTEEFVRFDHYHVTTTEQ